MRLVRCLPDALSCVARAGSTPGCLVAGTGWRPGVRMTSSTFELDTDGSQKLSFFAVQELEEHRAAVCGHTHADPGGLACSEVLPAAQFDQGQEGQAQGLDPRHYH